MPVRPRRLSLSRRGVVSTAVTAVLVGGTFAGLLSVTGAPKTAAAQSATPDVTVPATRAPATPRATAPSPVPMAGGPDSQDRDPRDPAAPPGEPGRTPYSPASGAPRANSAASVMQIVAHPDDDLFFMNPDISQTIRSGTPLAAVYLTAGESDGVNARPRDAAAAKADKAGYAEARQNGIRAAYSEMATGSRTSPWDRVAIPTAGGGLAELDTLRADPKVTLVWLQIREAGSTNHYRPHSLNGLWHGLIDTLESQRSSGTPVAADFRYTKDEVVATIAGLLDRFRPTFVRMQDPSPGTDPKTGKIRDHQDHLYGARFTQAALARYAELPGRPRIGVQNYLGYPTSVLPHTLDPETAGAKLKTLKTYAWLDGVNDCGTPAGCGDLKVAARPAGRGWTATVRYARGTSTSWVQPDRAGGLHAFSVLDGQLAAWRKPADGGAWRGPTLLPGGGMDSGVTSVSLPDGRIAVYGTRTLLAGGPAGYRREVVTTEQTAPGAAFGPWRSLGTPERNDAAGTSDISAPAVTVGADGRATLVLRDSLRRLTAREQRTDGVWGPWRVLGGVEVVGDPVAATDGKGRGYVFASTAQTVLVWAQHVPGGPLTGPALTALPPTTLALSATPAPNGDGVRLWFRKPASGDLRSADFSGAGPVSPFTELPGGVAGFGPVSGGDGLLAVRSRTGFLATAPHGRTGAAGPAWKLEKFLFAGAPDAGTDGVAAIGLDGRLHWTPAERGVPAGRGVATAAAE
ncbi:PIG-L family deacetylase [Streptomyces sp. SJL17-1]|uniref:PIG-L family deacetylase n=1 Tax=Streptomyces sp. SJL17-1 TaxID=2967223 RepID=UPI0029675BC7|nr:PIG-L family deacetylase [Streptomyces sp. SJL17-1]